MKTFPKLFLMFSMMASVSVAEAVIQQGPSTSGGGSAVVCRKPSGQIHQAMLLDLYEARVRYGLNVPQASGSLERDYLYAVDNTYTLQGYPDMAMREKPRILENLRRFFDNIQWTQPGASLPALNDLGRFPQLPQGCRLEQLAIFKDQTPEVILVDREIWNALDSMNQAALVSHELFYKVERLLKERTSESTRSIVAHIYSRDNLTPRDEGLPATGFLRCSASNPSDWVINQDPNSRNTSKSNPRASFFSVFPVTTPQGPGVRLQLEGWFGYPIISKTVFDIPGIRFETKKTYDRDSQEFVAIVDEPRVNLHLEVPVRGGLRPEWSLEIHYQTGQPIVLVAKDRGVIVHRQRINDCFPGQRL